MSNRRPASTLLRAAVARVARSLVRRAHRDLLASRSFTETLEPRQLLARATGIDVSHYSGTVNWSSVAAGGYSFAYAKATEGYGVTDADMSANLAGGTSAGLVMGAYHHAKPDAGANDAVNEANWFVGQAGNYIKPGYLRPALDVSENTQNLSVAALSTWVNTFCTTVKTATGIDPIVYTNNDYATNYLNSSVAANHDLWIARWSTAYGDPNTTGSPPVGVWGPVGEPWKVWQYTSTSAVNGVPGSVDRDVFNGDRAALDQYVIGATNPAALALHLNFAPTGSAAPTGYTNVAGDLFGTQSGQQMGWLTSGVTTYARTAAAPDGRYQTYAMPALSGVSRSFEVAVPNGSYTVHVVTGSPDQYPNAQKITVEGVTAVNASTSSTTPFLSGTVTVNVTDGRLTLGSDYNGSANTRLDYVDITSNAAPGGGFETGVAFGPDGSAAVPGYRTDLGNGYRPQSNGYTFGWVDPATGSAASNSGNWFARTLPAGSDPRLARGVTSAGKSWEMKVPNGTYYVTLVAGDADVSSGTYGYGVENVAGFLSGTATSSNHWITASGPVVVTDNKLTIFNTSGVTNHALAYVNITDYAAHNRSSVVAPIAVVATASAGNTVDVRWTDHSDNDTGFKVERLDAGGTPTVLYTTYANAGVYTDTNASPSTTYTYRVTALNGTFASAAVLSNAITTPGAAAGQVPYDVTRVPWTTDATIQAEDFDAGGAGVAFDDSTAGNAGGYYRAGDADVGYNVADDHYFLGWNKAGEWVEYTINVPTAGTYQFQTSVASEGVGGTFAVAVGSQASVANGTATKAAGLHVPDTGSFTTYQTITTGTFTLAAGSNQILRLTSTADDPSGYWVGDIDWIKLVKLADAPITATVSGYAWDDRNQNHVRDSSLLQGNPPSVVLVVDVSGSTENGFAGTPVGNANRDPYSDTILDAEIDGVIALNEQMIRAGQGNTANVSLVSFSDDASTIDVNPLLGGIQVFTHPSTDANNNGVPDIEEAARQLYSEDGTNFEAGLQQAIAALQANQVAPGNGNVVFLSDGYPNEGGPYDDEVATLRGDDVQLDAFGMGAGAGMDALRVIDPGAVEITSTDQVIDTFDGATGSQVIEEGLAGRRVFADLNSNGTFDAGEPSALTDADGNYSIGGLAAGTYTIGEVLQAGWTRTTPVGDTYQVTLAAGDVAKGRNFGEYQPGTGGNTGTGGGTGGNHLPSPVAGATQPAAVVKVGRTFAWNAGAAFTDADGDTLQFKPDPLLPLPTGMSLNPSTGQFTWTPQPGQEGMKQIAYIVSDGHGGSDYYGGFPLVVLPATAALAPAASITVATPSIHESNAGVATFTVTLDDPEGITSALTVNLDWSGGTAVASDYTLTNPTGTSLPTSVTFPLPASGTFGAGPQSVSFSVKAVDDAVADGDKTLSVAVVAGGGSYTQGTPATASVTIVDDGTRPANHPPQPVPTAPQPPTTATVGVQYTWDFKQDFTDPDGDTLNYTSLVAPPGDAHLDPTTGIFTWTPSAADVGDKQVSFVVDDGHGGMLPAEISVTVGQDNSSGGTLPVVTIEKMADAVETGQVHGRLILTRTGTLDQSLTVSYVVDATSTATPGDDYVSLSGTVVFSAGSPTATIEIAPVQDQLDEPKETIVVDLVSATGGSATYTTGTPSTAVATISDDADLVATYDGLPLASEVKMDLVEIDGTYVIPHSTSDGALSSVRIVPPLDDSYTFTQDVDWSYQIAPNGDVDLNFETPAPYEVEIERGTQTTWLMIGASTGFGPTGFKTFANVKTPAHLQPRDQGQLVLISNNGDDDKYTIAAKDTYGANGYTGIDNFGQLENLLAQEFTKVQGKFSLVIVGHAGPGIMAIGEGTPQTGILPNSVVLNSSANPMIAQNVTDLIVLLRKYTTSVVFEGCSAAEVGVDDPDTNWVEKGADFLQSIADGVGSGYQITGYDGVVAFSSKKTQVIPRQPGFWIEDGKGRKTFTGK